ncbi:MAG: sigma-70 family RNA polymerase sigma factor [Planctomycetota bacterium]|nr:sigma-70 family RNA polymerase sigma factor [Planctomycetota bacterium]
MHVGPATAELVSTSDGANRAAAMAKALKDPLDQILAIAFEERKQNPNVCGEFFAFFFNELPRGIVRNGFPAIRNIFETNDLASSAIKDLLVDEVQFQFRGRKPFQSWFLQKLKWKAMNKQRELHSKKRREDLRCQFEVEGNTEQEQQPEGVLLKSEEERAVGLALGKLNSRDRLLLRLHGEGASRAKIAETLGISRESLRQVFRRALKRLHDKLENEALFRSRFGFFEGED